MIMIGGNGQLLDINEVEEEEDDGNIISDMDRRPNIRAVKSASSSSISVSQNFLLSAAAAAAAATFSSSSSSFVEERRHSVTGTNSLQQQHNFPIMFYHHQEHHQSLPAAARNDGTDDNIDGGGNGWSGPVAFAACNNPYQYVNAAPPTSAVNLFHNEHVGNSIHNENDDDDDGDNNNNNIIEEEPQQQLVVGAQIVGDNNCNLIGVISGVTPAASYFELQQQPLHHYQVPQLLTAAGNGRDAATVEFSTTALNHHHHHQPVTATTRACGSCSHDDDDDDDENADENAEDKHEQQQPPQPTPGRMYELLLPPSTTTTTTKATVSGGGGVRNQQRVHELKSAANGEVVLVSIDRRTRRGKRKHACRTTAITTYPAPPTLPTPVVTKQHQQQSFQQQDEQVATTNGDEEAELQRDSRTVFCSTFGRLNLMNAKERHDVSRAEIKRRLASPECLNMSLLSGILRRAKTKNGGPAFRARLERSGLNVNAGRRPLTRITLFTSLLEAESVALAHDFVRIMQKEFPLRPIAEHIVHNNSNQLIKLQTRQLLMCASNENASANEISHPADDNDEAYAHTHKATYWNERYAKLLGSMQILNELRVLLENDRSPIANRRPPPVLPSYAHTGLSRFSNLTHGFGTTAVVGVLKPLEECVLLMATMAQARAAAASASSSASVVAVQNGGTANINGSIFDGD